MRVAVFGGLWGREVDVYVPGMAYFEKSSRCQQCGSALKLRESKETGGSAFAVHDESLPHIVAAFVVSWQCHSTVKRMEGGGGRIRSKLCERIWGHFWRMSGKTSGDSIVPAHLT